MFSHGSKQPVAASDRFASWSRHPVPTSSLRLLNQLPPKEVETIQKLWDQYDQMFSGIEESQAARLARDTKDMITFVQDRVQEWTGYTSSSLQVTLGLFAFSAAGLALISDPSKTPAYVYYFAVPFLGTLLLWSLYLFASISRQIAFDYPFTSVARTWRWFHLYCVPEQETFRPALFDEAKHNTRLAYLQGLHAYARRTCQMTPAESLRQNVEQLYLLLFYEGYHDQFAVAIHRRLLHGILIAVSLALIGGVLAVVAR